MAHITEVRIRVLPSPVGRCVAFASITLDHEWTMRDIRLIKGSREDPERMFAVFPRRGVDLCQRCAQTLKAEPHNGRIEDVAHPITHAARKSAEDAIVAAYMNELSLSSRHDYRWNYATHLMAATTA